MAKFWSSEKLVSISAILISLLTLMVFVYQTNLLREQQFLSVYPHLTFGNERSGTLDYEYILRNEGVGPAFIESIEISDKEKESYPYLSEYVNSKRSKNDSISSHSTGIYVGKLIPANKQIVLYGLWDENETKELKLPKNTLQAARKLRAILNAEDLEIKIRYRSIYNEHWTISSRSSSPEKIK